MMKKIIGVGLTFAPFLAFAQLTAVNGFVTQIGVIVGILTPIAFALGLLYFFWGLAQFILASGDPEKASEGKNKMIWGVVALFVMSTVFGLIAFIRTELNITDNTVVLPVVPLTPAAVPIQ